MAQTTHYGIPKPAETWSELHPGKGAEELVAQALDDVDAAIFAAVGAGGGGNFSDSEIPAGSLPGTAFTLAHTPVSGSVKLYLNGLRLVTPDDYAIAGAAITTVSTLQPGDSLLADYRY